MAWPQTAAATGETITAAQLNRLPTRVAETVATADAASLELSGIVSHFTHIRAVIVGRTTEAVASSACRLQINGNPVGPYYRQYIAVNQDVAAASEGLGLTFAQIGYLNGANAASERWSYIDVTFPDYAAGNRKTWLSDASHSEADASQHAGLWAGYASISSAISTITITPGGGLIAAGSRMTLYGLP